MLFRGVILLTKFTYSYTFLKEAKTLTATMSQGDLCETNQQKFQALQEDLWWQKR